MDKETISWDNMLASERFELIKELNFDPELIDEYANTNWDDFPIDIQNYLGQRLRVYNLRIKAQNTEMIRGC